MTPTLPPKKEVALALIERSDLFVHLDPRIDGVVVPTWFRKQPELVLRVGLNMAVPIPDLRFDDDSITCTLSFNRQPFYCVLPWVAVFGLRGEDGMGLIWPEDVPREVRDGGSAKPKEARKLSVVKDTDKGAEPDAPSDETRARASASNKAAAKTSDRPPESVRGQTSARPEKSRRAADEGSGADVQRQSARKEPAAKPRIAEAAPPPAPESAPAQPPSGKTRSDDDVAPDSPPPAHRGKAKPKRELPPYLRVIK